VVERTAQPAGSTLAAGHKLRWTRFSTYYTRASCSPNGDYRANRLQPTCILRPPRSSLSTAADRSGTAREGTQLGSIVAGQQRERARLTLRARSWRGARTSRAPRRCAREADPGTPRPGPCPRVRNRGEGAAMPATYSTSRPARARLPECWAWARRTSRWLRRRVRASASTVSSARLVRKLCESGVSGCVSAGQRDLRISLLSERSQVRLLPGARCLGHA
jgi:hypothetical protein